MTDTSVKLPLGTVAGGGGGGTASLAWGPDFGGVSGDHLAAVAAQPIVPAITIAPVVNGSALAAWTKSDLVYNAFSHVATAILDNINGTWSQTAASALAALTALAITHNISATNAASLFNLAITQNAISHQATASLFSAVANYTGFADANVSTTGSWTNPANALGDTTSTFASIGATSSGIGGITSNTSSGVITLGFADPTVLSSLYTLDGAVTVNVERAIVSSGTLPLFQSCNMAWEYSLNAGSSWTTFSTDTSTIAVAKSTITSTITGAVGGSWTKINDLQIRGNGSVTSGTGVNAHFEIDLYRAWVTLAATRLF